jgi:hypothetical protein
MAIIYTYPSGTPQTTDILIGSSPSVTGNPTRNFLMGDISVFIQTQIGSNAYDDNAAALLGGLSTGQLYQTTGAGAAPLNVAGIVMIVQ